MTDLEERGYKGIDESSNVRKWSNGIKIDATDVVKTQIITSEHLYASFNICIYLYQDFIKQSNQ